MYKVDETAIKLGSIASHWEKGFSFPKAFVEELIQKFPNWPHFHNALRRDDKWQVWGFLHTYLEELSKITPERVVKLSSNGSLGELVEQAQEALEFKVFLSELKKRFPGVDD